MNLSFHGAAGTVTGSRHLVRAGGKNILVDAGLFQGLKELRERNWAPPGFDVRSIDALLLTHAHLDHSGYIPRLVNEGFRGPVYCTPATAELAGVLLRDSAHLQEEDAAWANKKKFTRHAPALPLYTVEDAEHALTRFHPVRYGEWLDLAPGVRASFRNAGHLLGSAFIQVECDEGRDGRAFTLVFSGDLGRYDMPLHLDPDARPACEFLVMESTYGDRVHDPTPVHEQLATPLRRALDRGGIVLVPAFAVGRAQQVVLLITDLMNDGRIPRVPVDVNSPMALDATGIYLRHLQDHNLDDDLGVPGKSRLTPPGVRYHRSVEESKALVNQRGPRIVIASSGMMTGGRVLHHLERVLPEPKNLILFVGYQAPGTRGRSLLGGATHVRLHGKDVESRAELLTIHGLSGHADREEMMRWLDSAGGSMPRDIFLVHGEPEESQPLAERIRRSHASRVHIPKLGDAFELGDLATA